jgi:hypothetical protein
VGLVRSGGLVRDGRPASNCKPQIGQDSPSLMRREIGSIESRDLREHLLRREAPLPNDDEMGVQRLWLEESNRLHHQRRVQLVAPMSNCERSRVRLWHGFSVSSLQRVSASARTPRGPDVRRIPENSTMVFDGSALRQASDAPVPFRQRHVTFVRVGAEGRLEQAGTVAEKQEMLRKLESDDGLLAAWTGQYRTDVFWVDDVEAVRDALA